ncbi:TonB-dependent receptor [Carboxylicivirga sp. N1Y90]|uniref:TonB-dependent receptor n=1 Tax=Carboxylicivirga fragile TaxID=3417571 RepID=UPI003D34B26B|nr:TonB-dependent receptor [Marinilabiliaceae bacterium N1Y90]
MGIILKAYRLLITCCLLLLAFISQAQISSISQTDTLAHRYKLDEITVNAPINVLSIKQWPGSVAGIDSLELTRGNSYILAQQLNKVPGVLMQQGTLSTNRITIRGIGSRTPYNSNRIKAYWGNIPLTDGDGVTSIEDISFNDIPALQVLKGPSSALYGAGLGGVILIDPWISTPSKNQINFQSEVANYTTFSNQLSANLKHQKGFTTISTSHLSSNGYRNNSKYKRYNISLKGKYFLGKNTLHYLYNYRYLNGQIPSSLDSTDFYNTPEKAAASWAAIRGYEEANRHIASLELATQINSKFYHSVALFSTFSNLDELRPFNQLDESKKSIGLRDQLSYSHHSLRLEAGFELMIENNNVNLYGVKESNDGQLLSEAKIKRQYVNIFGLAEYTVQDKLLVQTALNINQTRYQHQDLKTNTKLNHYYPFVFSPRMGLNYQLSLSSHLYAAAGHGFSTPSVEEAQMPDGSFNEAIKPEEGLHFDLGYRFNSENDKTNAELTAYWMHMSNLLVTKRESEEQFYGINAGKTIHRGIEAQFKQSIMFGNSSELLLSSSYSQSINTFEEFIDKGNNYKGNDLPGIPKFSAYLGVNYRINRTNIHLNYQHWGEQYLRDDNSKRYVGFGVLVGKISQAFTLGAFTGQLYIGANNILNKHYASMVLINAPSFGNKQPRYYYPALPFNMYGGISIKLY